MKLTSSALIISIVIILVGAYKYLGLEEITVPILGLLMTIYLVISLIDRHRRKKNLPQTTFYTQVPMYLLLAVVYMIVIANGGIESPLFFLLSFSSFAIAFFLAPSTVFLVLIGTCLIFFPDIMGDGLVTNSLQLGSLVLFTPIAYYFGKELKIRLDKQKQDQESADRIRREAATVLRDNKNLPEENKIQLADIIQETDTLRD